MLSLGGDRLPTPPPPQSPTPHQQKKFWIITFFAHLLILEYPDNHQNLISSSLYYQGPLHKISSQSVHNFLSNVVHRQADKQTNRRNQKHNLLCQGGNDIICDNVPVVVCDTMEVMEGLQWKIFEYYFLICLCCVSVVQQ